MQSILQQYRTTLAERVKAQEAQRASLLTTARRQSIAVAEGENPPSPEEILATCDGLGVGLDWFDDPEKGAFAMCAKRIAEVKGLALVPGKKAEAEKIEAEIRNLEALASAANAAYRSAIEAVSNAGGGKYPTQDGTFSPYRNTTTAEELADIRDKANAWTYLSHRIWLAQRDAAAIRKEIMKLEKIDRNNIDPDSPMPPPHDFRLPPLS
jgi:hypothetical protein